MDTRALRKHCSLDARTVRLLKSAVQRFGLSARGCDRALRVSRTIADLAGAERIGHEHLAEALQFRLQD